MKKLLFFLMIGWVALAISCKKEATNPSAIPIQFELRLLNDKGTISTKFSEGENFTLSFIMRNPTDSLWAFRLATARISTDFFKVYDGQGNSFGKPFSGAFCSQEPSGATRGIEGKEIWEIKIPWVVKDSTNYPLFCNPTKLPFLKRGNYTTGFKGSFDFLLHGGKVLRTDTLNFNVNFSIL